MWTNLLPKFAFSFLLALGGSESCCSHPPPGGPTGGLVVGKCDIGPTNPIYCSSQMVTNSGYSCVAYSSTCEGVPASGHVGVCKAYLSGSNQCVSGATFKCKSGTTITCDGCKWPECPIP